MGTAHYMLSLLLLPPQEEDYSHLPSSRVGFTECSPSGRVYSSVGPHYGVTSSACKPALARTSLLMGTQAPSLGTSVCFSVGSWELQVHICSKDKLHGLQGDSLPHCDPGSGACSPDFSLALVFALTFSQQDFCSFLNMLSQRHYPHHWGTS